MLWAPCGLQSLLGNTLSLIYRGLVCQQGETPRSSSLPAPLDTKPHGIKAPRREVVVGWAAYLTPVSSSPLTSRQADQSWERAPGAAGSELPWLAGPWLLVCINQPAEGTGRWQRGHSPACHSAGLFGQCWTTPPLLALLAHTPLTVATVLDGDAPWGPPWPSGAWAPCQGRISGRGLYPLF